MFELIHTVWEVTVDGIDALNYLGVPHFATSHLFNENRALLTRALLEL